jgi:hypothetical protein
MLFEIRQNFETFPLINIFWILSLSHVNSLYIFDGDGFVIGRFEPFKRENAQCPRKMRNSQVIRNVRGTYQIFYVFKKLEILVTFSGFVKKKILKIVNDIAKIRKFPFWIWQFIEIENWIEPDSHPIFSSLPFYPENNSREYS